MADMDTYVLLTVLAISAVGTVLCWRRILRLDDFRFFKVANFIVAAIPIVGPLLYWFVDMPPRHGMNYSHSLGSFHGKLSSAELWTKAYPGEALSLVSTGAHC